MIIAETERLIISKINIKDAPFFLELMNTPHWLKYIGDRNIKSIEDAEEAIKSGHLKSYKNTSKGDFKII